MRNKTSTGIQPTAATRLLIRDQRVKFWLEKAAAYEQAGVDLLALQCLDRAAKIERGEQE